MPAIGDVVHGIDVADAVVSGFGEPARRLGHHGRYAQGEADHDLVVLGAPRPFEGDGLGDGGGHRQLQEHGQAVSCQFGRKAGMHVAARPNHHRIRLRLPHQGRHIVEKGGALTLTRGQMPDASGIGIDDVADPYGRTGRTDGLAKDAADALAAADDGDARGGFLQVAGSRCRPGPGVTRMIWGVLRWKRSW